jgi:hypothetical protein
MKKQEINYILLLIITMSLVGTSCSTKLIVLGQWKGTDRTMIISNDKFEIDYTNTREIKGLRGSAKITPNKLILLFTEYCDSKNEWYSVKGTELENHSETLEYKVIGDSLETYVVNNAKKYVYSRK